MCEEAYGFRGDPDQGDLVVDREGLIMEAHLDADDLAVLSRPYAGLFRDDDPELTGRRAAAAFARLGEAARGAMVGDPGEYIQIGEAFRRVPYSGDPGDECDRGCCS